MSMVWRCSSRVFEEASRAAASRASVLGSPLRGAVPAMGWARTRSPARATRSSGVAPTKPSTEKRWLAGYERRSWPSTAPAAERSVGPHLDSPGQHHLPGVAVLDAAGGFGHRAAPLRRRPLGAQVVGRRPLVGRGQPGVAGEPDGAGEAPGEHGGDLVVGGDGVGGRDGRDPAGAVVGAPDDHGGHHQFGRRSRVERQGPDGHRAATGQTHGVVDLDGVEDDRGGGGVGPAAPAGEGDAGGLAAPGEPAPSCTNRVPSSPATASRSGSESSGRVRATRPTATATSGSR